MEFASGLSLPFNSGDGEYVTWGVWDVMFMFGSGTSEAA